ncbi:hypothetical protein MCOR07_008971 [Pyricularia oryzae]|uniref:Uncharacterized protein n=5 Tax=Pyricularia TaxID=48558 RepID=A0ABQ8NAF8_PYRGI|nr:uncharacterized protein MGG_16239 [Pyricularia oryzae 70-15]ELQ36626.1 hypothetical protein OOU_Y34scaffold00649g9 [Pyricularia oryzae Y34]KAH8842099.1 hypothetical protein MCOR01_006036 [Pyricularia oryzae]KAI6293934.1 hypothetical protein MCOR33_008797 [Pyricularia grisea]EHA57149.1 hypothetical protein MGG_16239 [Pyricularia oryzae 70-15]KAI6284372.1 hypothetical protein MCOR26_002005 [Pyricularia oryzae]
MTMSRSGGQGGVLSRVEDARAPIPKTASSSFSKIWWQGWLKRKLSATASQILLAILQRTSIGKFSALSPDSELSCYSSTSRSCRGDGRKKRCSEIHKPHHRLLEQRCDDEAGGNGAGS